MIVQSIHTRNCYSADRHRRARSALLTLRTRRVLYAMAEFAAVAAVSVAAAALTVLVDAKSYGALLGLEAVTQTFSEGPVVWQQQAGLDCMPDAWSGTKCR